MLYKLYPDPNTNDSTNAMYVWKEIWRIYGPMEMEDERVSKRRS